MIICVIGATAACDSGAGFEVDVDVNFDIPSLCPDHVWPQPKAAGLAASGAVEFEWSPRCALSAIVVEEASGGHAALVWAADTPSRNHLLPPVRTADTSAWVRTTGTPIFSDHVCYTLTAMRYQLVGDSLVTVGKRSIRMMQDRIVGCTP